MGECTHGEKDDWCVPVIQSQLWTELVDEPEGKRHHNSQKETERNPLIPCTSAIELTRQTSPGNSSAIVFLYCLPRPNVCSLDGEEDIAFFGCDLFHH